jgi:hypothetical protein
MRYRRRWHHSACRTCREGVSQHDENVAAIPPAEEHISTANQTQGSRQRRPVCATLHPQTSSPKRIINAGLPASMPSTQRLRVVLFRTYSRGHPGCLCGRLGGRPALAGPPTGDPGCVQPHHHRPQLRAAMHIPLREGTPTAPLVNSWSTAGQQLVNSWSTAGQQLGPWIPCTTALPSTEPNRLAGTRTQPAAGPRSPTPRCTLMERSCMPGEPATGRPAYSSSVAADPTYCPDIIMTATSPPLPPGWPTAS